MPVFSVIRISGIAFVNLVLAGYWEIVSEDVSGNTVAPIMQ
jgi:hypothetical protein